MAILHSEVYEAQTSHGMPPQAQYANGKLRYAQVQYVTKGGEGTGDRIAIVRLKEGAVIVPQLSRVDWEDFGSGAGKIDAVKIGTERFPNRLAEVVGPIGDGYGGVVLGTANVPSAYHPQPLESGDEVVVLEILHGAAIPAGKRLQFLIAYIDE